MDAFIGSAVGAPANPLAARARRGSRMKALIRSPVSDGVADPSTSIEQEAYKKQQVEGETKTWSLQGAFGNPQRQETDKRGKKDGGPLVTNWQSPQQPA